MNIQQHIQHSSATLAACLQKIPRRHTRSQSQLVESLTRLACSLYISGQSAPSDELVAILARIRFSHDYSWWGWIEYALALQARTRRAAGDAARAAQAIRAITAPLDVGSELEVTVKKRVFARMLAGEMLSADGVREASGRRDPAAEYNERLICLLEMIKISAIKTESEDHDPALEAEISGQIARCRELINQIGLENTLPFKA